MHLAMKDVFFIHSKRAPLERVVVDKAIQLLKETGFSIWTYGDWNWMHEEKSTYAPQGNHIDIQRLAQGNPLPFKKITQHEEVDKDSLESIFKGSKVIVIMNPTRGRPSEGVIEEMQTLRYMHTLSRTAGCRFLLCQINTTKPHSLMTTIKYSGTFQLSFSSKPDDHKIIELVILIAIQFLDCTVEQHLTNRKFVGRHLSTDISHARLLVEHIQQSGFGAIKSLIALQHAISKAEEIANQQGFKDVR